MIMNWLKFKHAADLNQDEPLKKTDEIVRGYGISWLKDVCEKLTYPINSREVNGMVSHGSAFFVVEER